MSNKLQSALIGGAVFGVLTIFKALVGSVVRILGCCNCFLPIAGGVLAVYLYVKNSPAPVRIGDGAAVGAITGAIGGLLYLIIGMPLAYLVSAAAVEAQFQQLRQAGINIPGALGGFALFFVGGIIAFIMFIILALVGGLIGVPLFEKRKDGANMPPSPPPPPPPGYGGQQPPAGGYGGYGGAR